MARKRLKRGSAKDGSDAVEVDRISALPNAVIHHIFSFLPTLFAVRMSVLSRRWRRAWHSIPTLFFPYLRHPPMAGFSSDGGYSLFVEKCMKHRRRAMRFVAGSPVTSFKFAVSSSPERFAGLDKWFNSSIVMKNVKELDLCVRVEGSSKRYNIPSAVLNGRCLTHLKLGSRVLISKSCSVNLPSLKSLFLKNVIINSEALHNLVLGCPSLEKCVLFAILCPGELRISSHSLKSLDLSTDNDTEEAKFKTVNLQSLVLRSGCSFPYEFAGFTGIKDLIVQCSILENLEDEIPKLTSLENLTVEIEELLDPDEMCITNRNLKHLSFHKSFGKEFKLDVSYCNLDSFTYVGNTNFSLSMYASCVKGKFSLSWFDDETELTTFLSNTNCGWTSVSLFVSEDADLIVPKKLRTGNPPWPDLKHLEVITGTTSRRKAEFRKALQWLFPSLETLSIETSDEDYSDPLYEESFGNRRIPRHDMLESWSTEWRIL